ncbi:hypothetical protein Tco_1207529, partial [Tanacetum coccineum]
MLQMPELVEDATAEAIKIRAKWENDDYICRGHILNGMSDSLFDVYTNVESAKELWDSLESKYMVGDSSSKKFLTRHGEKDEPSISSPKPVNATIEFVDDMDFASDILTDGPATVEMVNATKDNFDKDDLVKFQELLLDADKP